MQQASSNPIKKRRYRRDSGAMLLAVLFMMAMMVLTALAIAPAFVLQAKRDREEEMIHRGTEYERAIRRYYRKFGRYPANIEQLENTNQLHFLRKKYSDPLTKDGEWKLLHYGDVQALLGAAQFGIRGFRPGAQGGLQGTNPLNPQAGGTGALGGADQQGASSAPAGAQLSAQQPGAGTGTLPQGYPQSSGDASQSTVGGSGGTAGQSTTGSGQPDGQTGGVGGSQGATGATGSNNTIFGNTGVGGQTFGGGAIVGVASKSKDPTIRVINQKKTYDEWLFVYSPMMDRTNSLLRGPFSMPTFTPVQVGIPAGQLNQGAGGGVGAQEQGAPGVQLPPVNQQPVQQPPAGTQFPPDQTQSPPPL